MLKKIVLGVFVVIFTYIAWTFLATLTTYVLFIVGCCFLYKTIKTLKENRILCSFKNIFLTYLFIVPACIMQGTLVIHWDNIYKVFSR